MNEPHLIVTIHSRVFCIMTALAGILLGLVSGLAQPICLPLSMAAFALLFIYEPRQGRIISYAAPILLIAACAFLFPSDIPIAVCSPLSAALMAFFYKTKRPKFDVAIYVMGLFLLAELFVLWISAATAIGSWLPAEAVAYYTELLTTVKTELVASIQAFLAESLAADALSAEYVLYAQALADTFFSLLLGLFAVLAFWIAGLALKVLSAVILRVDEDRGVAVRRWHFTTPVMFAYFYIALFLLYMLFSGNEGIFSVTVGNLYVIFLVIYAYIGWKYLRFMLARSPRFGRYRVLLIAALLLFSTLAVQLLAIEGVVAVITAHRLQKNRGDGEP